MPFPPLPRRRSPHLRALHWALTALILAAASPAAEARSFRVDTTLDSVDAAPGDGVCQDAAGFCSLRAAVQEANARGRATIRLERDLRYALALAGAGEDAAASGDLDVTGRLKIVGRDATIDAAGLDRIFDVRVGGDLRFNRLVLTGGAAPDGEAGGAVRNAGRLDARRSLFSENSAPGAAGAGGAIANAGGSMRVLRSLLRTNSAAEAGGAVASDGGLVIVDRSTLRENQSSLDGGALHVVGSGELWVGSSDLDGNSAASRGGGAWVGDQSDRFVFWSVFQENEAQGAGPDEGGGALYNEADAFVFRTTLVDNLASGAAGAGGAVLQTDGELELDRSSLRQNQSGGEGGGVAVSGGAALIVWSLLFDNDAGSDGGGLQVGPGAEGRVFGTVVVENGAGAEGGGLWCSATGSLDVDRSDVEDNDAPAGPDVFNEPPGGDFTIDDDPVPPG